MKNEIFIGSLCLLLIVLGSVGTLAYQDWKNEKTLNGLYIYNLENTTSATEYAYSKDKKGDWVCINVAYDMTPEEAYTTCIHECSHKAFSEIYAQKCEDEPLTCLEALYDE